MQKPKKKLLTFLAILFLGITTGCQTTKQKNELPPKPERQEIQAPQTLKDCAEIINYYEHLVEEWEQWGVVVTDLYYLEN